VLSHVASEGARLIRVLVLARLLAPHDFGLMGIASLVLACVEVFTEPGLNTALIQRRGDIRPFLDSVFTINATRGAAVSLLSAALAPMAAAFWDAPRAAWVIAAAGAVVFVRGLSNPATVYLIKDLNFRAVFWWNLGDTGAALCTAVACGLLWHNVWALVASAIVGQAVRTALSYRLHPFRPRLRFDWSQCRNLLPFSRWVMATNIVVYLGLRADSALVGRWIGVGALGLYEMASRIASVPRETLTAVAAEVAFPALSARQEQAKAMRGVFIRIWVPLLLANAAAAFIMVVFPQTLLRILAGKKWSGSAEVLGILAVAQFLRAAAVLPTHYFYAAGRPNLTFYVNLVRAGVLVVSLGPLARSFGLNGAALASLAGASAMTLAWAIPFLQSWRAAAAINTTGTFKDGVVCEESR